MGRPAFGQKLRQEVSAKTGGRCQHCGCALEKGWHVDHHPIPFRDIENNVCCCALRDPKAVENLVPSCPTCNTSHKFEPAGKPWYCQRTQPYCSEAWVRWAGIALLVGSSLAGNVWQAVQTC